MLSEDREVVPHAWVFYLFTGKTLSLSGLKGLLLTKGMFPFLPFNEFPVACFPVLFIGIDNGV